MTNSSRRRAWIVLFAVFLGAVAFEFVVAWFIKSKGVHHLGDAPAYVIQAQAFSHLTPNILSTLQADLHSHARFNGSLIGHYPEMFRGPRGVVSPFEPGLGLLLVPFVATGYLFVGPTLGMLCLATAGLMFLHRRVTALAGLSRLAQLLLAILFAAPAVLLAVTQIYPDFISGVLVAAGVVEIALIERTGRISGLNAAVVAVSAAVMPWLQIKNLAPAVVLIAAWAAVARRKPGFLAGLSRVWAVALSSWIVLLAYDVHYFGRVLGYPEPPIKISKRGLEYTLGLLLDRHQGLFVQAPFTVLGLIGLWLAWRRLPIAASATIASLGAILLLNGSYIHNPYGGDGLAGRFMWTLLPGLISWAAIVVARWETAGRRLWLPLLVTLSGYLWQAFPILQGEHVYFNAFGWNRLHNPGPYPGWWPGLDPVLPRFGLPGRLLGAPALGIAAEMVLGCGLIIGVLWYTGVLRLRTGRAGRHLAKAKR